MKTQIWKRVAHLALVLAGLAVLGPEAARATLLSQVIAGGQTIQSGRLVFSNFAVPPTSGVTADQIDVVPTVDANGNPGLLFTTSALVVSGAGNILADVTFNAATSVPGATIQAIHQSFAATVSGIITAYDFTTIGAPGSTVLTVASNCVNGDQPGCPQNLNASDNATLPQPLALAQVDRQVQLLAAKQGISAGSIPSYDVTFTVLVRPALQLSVTHTGPWTQGQTGAQYTLTVSDATGAGPTAGTVNVTESLPVGLTLVSMSGTGWTCAANTCSRGDVLQAGASYPPIIATVSVAVDAASPLLNTATASGGGSSPAAATDSTIINLKTPVLSINQTHTGTFAQGQTGAVYTVVVSNGAAAGPTSGTVTVTETLPAGLTLVSMSGTGWTCVANTCSRSDVLATGASYPVIAVAVNVAANAPSPLTASVSVSGGGSSLSSTVDPTVITSTVKTPLLSIAKSHTGNFTQTQSGVYTVIVSNGTAGPTTGTVTVSESLPAGLTLVSMTGSGWSCAATTCTRTDALQAAAAYPPITVTVNVTSNATSPQLNVVTVAGGGSGSSSASDSTTILSKAPVLSVTSSHTGNFSQGQKGAIYTLLASNGATAPATNGTVTVNETLPVGLTLVSMTGTGWTCSGNSCKRSDVLATGATYPAITVTVNVAANAASPLINTVSVSGGGSSSATASDSTLVIAGGPALTISKSHVGNFTPGQAGAAYAVIVSNPTSAGPTTGTVTVTETLPTGLSLVSMSGTGWTCAASVCTRADVLAAGASYPAIAVAVNVSATAASPQVNTVSVTGGGSAAASASDSTVIAARAAVLSISKTHTGNFKPGQAGAIYTLAVNNAATAGPTTGAVTVTETVPAGLSLVSMTGTGWTCAANSCSRADALAAGGGYPAITVTVNVAANATSPVVNTVSVSGGGSAVATAADSTVIAAAAPVLSIVKSHLGNFTQAQNGATYTVSVNNAAAAGPTSGTVTVTESLPAGLTLTSMSGTGWTCALNTCSRADALAAGAGYPAITVTVNVAANAASPVVNSVTVTGGGSAPATAADSTTINPNAAILSISKSHAGAFTQGQAGAAYTIVVSNAAAAGPTNGTATVTESAPAGLTLASMSGTGWTCALNTCSRADVLAAAASYPAITVTVNVAANATSPVVNTASVSGGGSATASAADSTIINPKPPVLSISGSHIGNFTQGQNGVAYTVSVSNGATAGPTIGTISVTETLPAGLTLVSMSGTGWSCVAATCSRADVLAAATSYPAITVTVNVAANAASPLVNAVSVSGGGSAGASATDPTIINPNPAVLSIGKSHTGNFTQGQAGAAYTLLVANAAGAGPTNGAVTVTEALPAGLALASMSGTGWTCVGASCSRSDVLPAGAIYPAIIVTVNVAVNAPSPLVNVASVSGGGSATASAADPAIVLVPVPVLSVVKSHAGSFSQGQNGAIYTVTVSNRPGGAPTSGTVTVTEAPPAGLALVSMAGTGWNCAGATCSRTDALPAGATWPAIAVTVDVLGNAVSPQVNVVTVSGGGSAAAVATDSTIILSKSPVLSIASSHTGNFALGQIGATYTLVVSSASTAPATNGTVTVTENLPSGLTLISMSGTGWTCSSNTCRRSDVLATGGTYPAITVTVNVAPNAASPVVNSASVSGGGSSGATTTDSTTVI